jgi:hypothetical protein
MLRRCACVALVFGYRLSRATDLVVNHVNYNSYKPYYNSPNNNTSKSNSYSNDIEMSIQTSTKSRNNKTYKVCKKKGYLEEEY